MEAAKTQSDIELAKKTDQLEQLNIEMAMQETEIRMLKQKLEEQQNEDEKQKTIDEMVRQADEEHQNVMLLEMKVSEKDQMIVSEQERQAHQQSQLDAYEQEISLLEKQIVPQQKVETNERATQTDPTKPVEAPPPEQKIDNKVVNALEKQLEDEILINNQLQSENELIETRVKESQQEYEEEQKQLQQRFDEEKHKDSALIEHLDRLIEEEGSNQPYTLTNLDEELTVSKAKLVVIENENNQLKSQITFLRQREQENEKTYTAEIEGLISRVAKLQEIETIYLESEQVIDALKLLVDSNIEALNENIQMQGQIGNEIINHIPYTTLLKQQELEQEEQSAEIKRLHHLHQLYKMK